MGLGRQYFLRCSWSMGDLLAIKQTIVWGTEAVKGMEKPKKGYTKKTYYFDTKKEYEAFMQGVEEANGWLEYDCR